VVKIGQRRVLGSFVVILAAQQPHAAAGKPPEERQHTARRRLGVTVSKRVGNAVVRNRVKRRIREWFRHKREALPDRLDLVVIARQSARELSSSQVAQLLNQLITESRIQGGRQHAVAIQ